MAISSTTNSSTSLAGGTNIDVNGLVSKLMTIEQRPLTVLNNRQATVQSKISAVGQVKSSLAAFQTALQGLSSATKFQANTATSSDTSTFTASASSSAIAASHTIDVANLAQSQRLATAGQASTSTAIGNGTLTFDFGTISGGTFNASTGKYGGTILSNATVANGTFAATAGIALGPAQTSFTPDATSAGTIPAGTFTVNGVSVGAISLLGVDSSTNIAAALDAAYVASGGAAGTFTAVPGGAVTKAAGATVTFGMSGTAADAATSAANQATLAFQTGLIGAQLGTQAYSNATVTVASTAGLAAGVSISGGGFPAGTTIASITDATHFTTTAAGTNATGVSLNATTATNTTTFTPNTTTSKTVTIDPTNNTLQGIRDAINTANIGVTASIVNDGSASPYRLVLSSNTLGAANSMKITVAGDAALSSLLSNDPTGTQNLSEMVTAKNAAIVVDGISVSKASNTISDVIPGVTLNLLKPTTSTATVSVSQDTATVQTSIQSFVKTYNDLSTTIKNLTAYNATTKQAAILQGDSAIRSLKSQIDKMLSNSVATAAGSLTSLSQIGVSRQTDGTLAIDSTKLSDALSAKFSDVAGLFSAYGKTSDSLVTFKTASTSTVPGNYAVDVTTLATQGNAIGNVNLNAGSTTIAAGTSISATVDGTNATVSLTAGTYTASALATMIQSAINGTSAFSTTGRTVVASIDNSGFLNLYSNNYGTSSNVSLTDSTGTLVAAFMGTGGSTAGVNVAGTINGLAATGSGQTLISSSGNSAGLQVQVAGGALGPRGTVNFSQGYAYKLNEFANSTLGANGLITSHLDSLNSSVTSNQKQVDSLNARLTTIEARLRRQYSALDTMLGKMNTTSTYLSQQLAKM